MFQLHFSVFFCPPQRFPGVFQGGSGKQARAMNILEDWEEKGERAGIYGKVEGSRSLSLKPLRRRECFVDVDKIP